MMARRDRQPVLLLHGIWLIGSAMGLLARRLAAAGYAPHSLTWPSVRGGPDAAIAAIRAAAVHAAGDGPLHWVGHSLGGLVALETIRRHPELPPGRVLCLGSPLAGSLVAQALARYRLARWLTGRSQPLLRVGIGEPPPERQIGSIAGSVSIGLGAVLADFAGAPHDGTVSVAETRTEWLADHCTVRASHSGLLFSGEAARQTIAFLRDGRFAPTPTGRP